MTPKIFITNASRYLNGSLIGKWVEIPVSQEDLLEILVEIGIPPTSSAETFISDHEGFYPYKVKECDSVESLNEIAEFLNELDYVSRIEFESIYEVEGHWKNAQSIFRCSEYRFYREDSYFNLGAAVWDDLGYNEVIPDNLKQFIDYESFGRSLDFTKTSRGFIEIY